MTLEFLAKRYASLSIPFNSYQSHAVRCCKDADNPNQLIEAILPALCELPSRRSCGCIYIGDTFPNERDLAFSLPQQYYIATFICWTDPAWDARMHQWLR